MPMWVKKGMQSLVVDQAISSFVKFVKLERHSESIGSISAVNDQFSKSSRLMGMDRLTRDGHRLATTSTSWMERKATAS